MVRSSFVGEAIFLLGNLSFVMACHFCGWERGGRGRQCAPSFLPFFSVGPPLLSFLRIRAIHSYDDNNNGCDKNLSTGRHTKKKIVESTRAGGRKAAIKTQRHNG